MTTGYLCTICQEYNQRLGQTLGRYFGYGRIYNALYYLFEREDFFTDWEAIKRHDKKKHGMETTDSDKPLAPSF